MFRHETSRELALRQGIRASAREGRIRYLTSGWAIEELAALTEHDDRKYARVARFTFDLVGPNFVDDPPALVPRELRLGRRLRGAERMVPPEQLAALRRGWMDLSTARTVSDATRSEKAASKIQLEEMRARSQSELAELAKGDPLDKGDPQKAALRWFREAPRWLDEWSRTRLAELLEKQGWSRDLAPGYPLERVPTLTNIIGMMLARIAWNVGHGRRIDESDDLDSRHYVAASYSDLCVTNDKRWTEIIAMVPGGRVPVMTVADFARKHLGW